MNPQKTKTIAGVLNTPLTASDLVSIQESNLSYFDKLYKKGEENERYLTGQNLSEEQEKD